MWTDDIAKYFKPGDAIWMMTLDGPEDDRMFWTPDKPDSAQSFMMYRHIDKKVKPVPGVYPQEAQVVFRIPYDPLMTLAPLSPNPPDVIPTVKLTLEQLEALNINSKGFLYPEEEKLF